MFSMYSFKFVITEIKGENKMNDALLYMQSFLMPSNLSKLDAKVLLRRKKRREEKNSSVQNISSSINSKMINFYWHTYLCLLTKKENGRKQQIERAITAQYRTRGLNEQKT